MASSASLRASSFNFRKLSARIAFRLSTPFRYESPRLFRGQPPPGGSVAPIIRTGTQLQTLNTHGISGELGFVRRVFASVGGFVRQVFEGLGGFVRHVFAKRRWVRSSHFPDPRWVRSSRFLEPAVGSFVTFCRQRGGFVRHVYRATVGSFVTFSRTVGGFVRHVFLTAVGSFVTFSRTSVGSFVAIS